MESKLLVGGKNIVDHTNEQQKILEQKRQEIAEQVTEFILFVGRMGWGRLCYATEQMSLSLVSLQGSGSEYVSLIPADLEHPALYSLIDIVPRAS